MPTEPSEEFRDSLVDLRELYGQLPTDAAAKTQTKLALWLDMLRASGMAPDPDDVQEQGRLFVTHSFLISIARFVEQSILPRNRTGRVEQILKDGFASWIVDSRRGTKWADDTLQNVAQFDWRRRQTDVLRALYEGIVEEGDRRVFGEFYTPDWLARMMVDELLDEGWIRNSTCRAIEASNARVPLEGVGILDPTCGSGTFLYHAALKLVSDPAVESETPGQRANIAATLLNGMDIHPVAVEIARVNVMRALPAEPTDGPAAIQVYLGDSLQADLGRSHDLFTPTREAMRIVTPENTEILIPTSFVRRQSFPDDMRRLVKAAEDNQSLPTVLTRDLERAEVEELEECRKQFAATIASEGNSVWTWYAVNLAAPHLLAERKVDRIVANPPWVKFADIQVADRKQAMKEMAKNLRIWDGGKYAPHTDIASLFVLRTRHLYMQNPPADPGAWLVKRSALHTGQWKTFRAQHAKYLAQTVDFRDLDPFEGGEPRWCCLLMENRPLREVASIHAKRLEARPKGKRPKPDHGWDRARSTVEFGPAPLPIPRAPSAYREQFRQGATVVPHVLLLVNKAHQSEQPGYLRVTTGRSSKGAWKNIPSQNGLIPEGWIRTLYRSESLMPFIGALEPTTQAIIPINEHGALHPNPSKECQFWEELEEIYGRYAGKGSNTPKTLLAQIDFSGKLRAQIEREEDSVCRMVMYPSSGLIMRAGRWCPSQGVADSKLYWWRAGNATEAGYLVSVLNAPCLQRAFAESRNSGRDFHKFRLPYTVT